MTVDEALVLGGGGVSGIAWMTGLLTGLAEAGQDGAAEDSGSMIGSKLAISAVNDPRS